MYRLLTSVQKGWLSQRLDPLLNNLMLRAQAVGAWLGLKCMSKGWGEGVHNAAGTRLHPWSCLVCPSVYPFVSYMHVLVTLVICIAKWSSILRLQLSPPGSIYSPAQNNFQQFSKLYLPTADVWFTFPLESYTANSFSLKSSFLFLPSG